MRVIKNDYIMKWENERQSEMKELLSQGILPYTKDVEDRTKRYTHRPPLSLYPPPLPPLPPLIVWCDGDVMCGGCAVAVRSRPKT
jgi:hypothetical protein